MMKQQKMISKPILMKLVYAGSVQSDPELDQVLALPDLFEALSFHKSNLTKIKHQYFGKKGKYVSNDIKSQFEHDHTPLCDFLSYLAVEYRS